MGKAKGLKYVYIGNMPGLNRQNTACPGCNAELVNRSGFSLRATGIRDGKCIHCGEPVHGVDMG